MRIDHHMYVQNLAAHRLHDNRYESSQYQTCLANIPKAYSRSGQTPSNQTLVFSRLAPQTQGREDGVTTIELRLGPGTLGLGSGVVTVDVSGKVFAILAAGHKDYFGCGASRLAIPS